MSGNEFLWMNGAIAGFVMLILGVLFRTLARLRADTTATARDIYGQLTNFRIEVAKQYVTANHLRDVEDRIMNRLDSIEKLVRNSLKK